MDTYAYTSYGVPTASTGTDANPFRYGGQAGYYTNGNAAGAVLCTYRWYSPDMGRWLTRDPISYSGGHNLYGYCNGDPVGGMDPDGHLAQLVRGGPWYFPNHYFIRFQDANGNWISIGFWPYLGRTPGWVPGPIKEFTPIIPGCGGQFKTPDPENDDDPGQDNASGLTVIDENKDPLVAKRLGSYVNKVKKWGTCPDGDYLSKEDYNYLDIMNGNCFEAAITIYKAAIHNELFPYEKYYPDPPRNPDPPFSKGAPLPPAFRNAW